MTTLDDEPVARPKVVLSRPPQTKDELWQVVKTLFGVEIPTQDLIDIGVDGADGAGRDPAFGARAVRVHGQAIVDAVRSRLAGADAFVLMAGLGGGTGSAVAELIDVLLPLEVPILVVCTLPSDGEMKFVIVGSPAGDPGLSFKKG